MIKNYIILYFTALLLICCNGDKKPLHKPEVKNDSLEFYLSIANNDSMSYQKRFKYAKKAEGIVLAGENDSLNRVNLFRVANRYWNIKATDDYRQMINKIMLRSEMAKDSIALAKIYYYFGDYFNQESISDSSYIYYDKSESLYLRLHDEMNVAQIRMRKAIVRYNESDYAGCEKSIIEILKFLRKNDNSEMVYECYNMLGVIYCELYDYNKALEYHLKALEVSEFEIATGSYHAKAITFNNIGYLYRQKNDHRKAISFFQKALKQKNILTDKPDLYSSLKDNLAYSKFKIRDFSEIPKLFYEALQVRDSLNLIPGIISSSINLSEYYTFKGNNETAKFYALKAYYLAKKSNRPQDILLSLKRLSISIPSNKHVYLDEYLRISDNLQLRERQVRNKFARIEYETEELTLEKDKLVEQRKTILYIASTILLILILILLFWYQKAKNRELVFIKEQQKTNEEIYRLILDQQQKLEEGKQLEKKRISKELHDGVMGRLTSIRLNLFVLSKKSDQETISKCLDHIQEIQEVEKEIKTIAYDLGKNLFSNNINFETVVKNIFRAIENHSEINFKLYIDENIDWEQVNGANKIQIYRILQESLQNMDKYSQATNVILSMKKTNEAITIEVKDDGIGFDKKKIKKGFGLKNMKERAKEINAKIRIESEPGNGTRVSLTLPIK